MNQNLPITFAQQLELDTENLTQFMAQGVCYVKIPETIQNDYLKIRTISMAFLNRDEDYKQQFKFEDGDGYLNQELDTVYTIQRFIYRKQLTPVEMLECKAELVRVRNYIFTTIISPLLSAIFKKLKLDTALSSILDNPDQTMSCIYYPDRAENNIRLGAHQDSAMLTVLWAPEAGFEAKLNGKWQAIENSESVINVQIGKALQLMTDGACQALEHRVNMSVNKARFSLASFFSLNFDSPLINFITNKQLASTFREFVKRDGAKLYKPNMEKT